MAEAGMDPTTLRYSRQLILDGFGPAGQAKLRRAKVLVIGAGGLGSPALLYLAAVGVGRLGVADCDAVTFSNLNRQIIHDSTDIGRPKTESAAAKIGRLNPEVEVIRHDLRLNIDNVEELVRDYDLVIDATDNFTARYLINDCCYLLGKPVIEGAAVGYDGVLMTIIPGQTPCYRCLYPQPPPDGVLSTCSDTGVLGMTTGIIGTVQALEAVKLILGIGTTLSGRILTFDALTTGFREVPWRRRPECPLCGENPSITELVEYKIQCRTKEVL